MALDIYKQTGDDVTASEFNQIISEINNNGSAIGNKVDKVSGKSLVADTEITRLATVTNQDISGKANTADVYTKIQSDNKYLGTGTTIPSISGLASETWVLAKNYISGATWAGLPDKPSIPSIVGLATVNYVDDEVESLQNQIDVLAGGDFYTKNEADTRFLGTGNTIDYNSLSNKPSIPSIAGLATESFVTGKGYITGATWAGLPDKPSIPSLAGYATEAWVNGKGFLTGSTFSGSYLDLTDKPNIPSISGLTSQSYVDGEIDNLQGQIDEISSGGADLTNYYTKEQANYTFISTATTLFSGSYTDLTGKPNLNVYLTGVTWNDVSSKPSLFDGDYNSLANKPSIPVITGLTTKVYVDGEIDTVETALANKVDKDGSKVLTDNNYTSTEKAKLASIASGATVNSSDATLLNRANHTGSMPASGLTQSSSFRFVTDTEKTTWNGKQDIITGTGYTYVSGSTISTVNGGLNDMLLGNGTFTSINPRIRVATIMGVSPTNSAIADNDSIVTAFNKLQGQINVKQGTLTLTVTGSGAASISGSTLNIPTPNLSSYELLSNKSSGTTLGTSNTLYPTQNAVKTYVDSAVETRLPISGSTSFISNSTDSFGSKVTNIVSCSQAQYDGITPDANTFYIII